MKVGYGFWGFLGDKKYNKENEEISTPDGNAFYSWSIIKAFQDAGHEVTQVMPDRDIYGFSILGKKLFLAMAEEKRFLAYLNTEECFEDLEQAKSLVKRNYLDETVLEKLSDLDFVLWEWRWKIPGRNTLEDIKDENFQPDYILQDLILKQLKENNIPVIVFDLDYKLTEEDIIKYDIYGIIELGDKWANTKICKSKRVNIPFDFDSINEKKIINPSELVVYIGNRYERDWCIDKYIPDEVEGITVHGNWLESNRDSNAKWPHINFGKRLQLSEMYGAYSKAAVSPLLAKDEYCKYGFMTARIIEAVYYGCVPLIIEEFNGFEKYLPRHLVNDLVIRDKFDVLKMAEYYQANPQKRKRTIEELREFLRFMDAKFFVQDVISLIK